MSFYGVLCTENYITNVEFNTLPGQNLGALTAIGRYLHQHKIPGFISNIIISNNLYSFSCDNKGKCNTYCTTDNLNLMCDNFDFKAEINVGPLEDILNEQGITLFDYEYLDAEFERLENSINDYRKSKFRNKKSKIEIVKNTNYKNEEDFLSA